MGGSSKAQTVGYWYEIAFHSGLGIGPIDAYLEFRGGDKTAWRGEVMQSQTIQINAPNLWGGEKDQGGIVGAVDLMFGEPTQMPNPRLSRWFGPAQPAWRGVATLAFAGRYGAMNPYPQKASHKLRRILAGWEGEPWYPGKAAIPMPACDGREPFIYVTSTLYPTEFTNHAEVGLAPISGSMREVIRTGFQMPDDALLGLSAVSGSLFSPSAPAPEAAVINFGITPVSGFLGFPPESRVSDVVRPHLNPVSGSLRTPPIVSVRPSRVSVGLTPAQGKLNDA